MIRWKRSLDKSLSGWLQSITGTWTTTPKILSTPPPQRVWVRICHQRILTCYSLSASPKAFPPLQLVEIYFVPASYDEIERDRKLTLEAQLGLIGGTMGLLTGFSILRLIIDDFSMARFALFEWLCLLYKLFHPQRCRDSLLYHQGLHFTKDEQIKEALSNKSANKVLISITSVIWGLQGCWGKPKLFIYIIFFIGTL